ncbi:FG-GAP repeat domain-containing protein [Planctomycetota bacterium]
MMFKKQVLLISLVLLFVCYGQLFGAAEDFGTMALGDWLSTDGTVGIAIPPYWTVDTSATSFGHPDYPGYIRNIASNGPDSSNALEVGAAAHANGKWGWFPSMPPAAGLVTFTVQFNFRGKLPSETSPGNRAMFYIGTSTNSAETVFLAFKADGTTEFIYRNSDLVDETVAVPGLLTDGSWNTLEVEMNYDTDVSRARLNAGAWASVSGITAPSNLNDIGFVTNGIIGYDNFTLSPDGPDPEDLLFVNRTSLYGLGIMNTSVRIAWADFNNDGWTDLCAGGSQIWRNNAGLSFTMIDSGKGLLWGDYDNDGFMDLFEGDQLFKNISGTSFVEQFGAVPSYDSQYFGHCFGDWDGDGYIDTYSGDFGGTSRAYHNNAGVNFSTVWSGYAGKTYGTAVCDFDSDFDMDIYVSNYWQMANVLWVNNGSGTAFPFSDQAAIYGVDGDPTVGAGYGHSMGAGFGDFDNDGYFDLAALNFNHHDRAASCR